MKPDQRVRSPTGVAVDLASGVAVLSLGPGIDETTARALVAQGRRAGEQVSSLIVDARAKGFASLEAQRLISMAKREAEAWQRVALWVRPEQLASAQSYAPKEMAVFADPARAPAPEWVVVRHREARRGAHLIAGSTGAGKSTYAMRLATDLRAFYAATDDWMDRLFSADRPDDAGFDWYMPRIERCEAQILEVCRAMHRAETPCVLDLGLTTREHRARMAGALQTHGTRVWLHFVDAPAERRWQRVQQRNAERGATYRLEVTREMFDFVEGMFEPPSSHELDDFVHFTS